MAKIAAATPTTTEGSATAESMNPTDDRDRTNPVEECRFLLESASDAGATLRAMGGAAIAIRCRAAECAPFARSYKDIDFATRSGSNKKLERLFELAGYTSDPEFNAINAHRRLIFWDPRMERKVDVFVDQIEMCHALDIKDRIELERETLPLADLLLLKLQIVESTGKDYVDALTLFVDHSVDASGIDGDYVAGHLAKDWGWWRTATQNLQRLLGYIPTLPDFPGRDKAEAGIRHLLAQVEDAP